MSAVEIICLANSRKRGGRCVAGIRTDGGGWVRPVVDCDDGALRSYHYILPDGSEPRVLDVIRLHLAEPRPGPHHPEDWLLRHLKWELVRRPADAADMALLRRHLVRGPELFGNTSDRIAVAVLERRPLEASLALVQPEELSFRLVMTSKGHPQARAVFALSGVRYNLVISEPGLEESLKSLGIGDHTREVVGLRAEDRVWLTTSVTEPYHGECYKLVAAVVRV